MLFKSIELYNFGRYGGKNFFDTMVTSDRNVILVRALNDRGKTTLFKAIKFALYGENSHMPARQWINFQRAAEGNGEMYVEVKFEHGKKEYRLRRSLKFRKTEKGKEIDTVGGSTIDLFDEDGPIQTSDSDANKKDWIDTILPQDASQFFFFDGEEIRQYVDRDEEETRVYVQMAIEKVLGIKELVNAKHDLHQVNARFTIEYQKNIQKHARDTKDRNKLASIQNDLGQIQIGINADIAVKRSAEKSKDQWQKELAQYGAIKDIVAERDEAGQQLAHLKKSLKEEKNSLTKNRGNLGLVLLSELLHAIDQTEENPPSIEQWESKTIQHMLNKDLEVCVCGRPIDEKVHTVFNSKILKLKPSKESELKRFVERMLIDDNPDQKWKALQESLESVSVITQNIDKVQSAIDRCDKEIRTSEITNTVQELEKKYEDAVKDIGKAERRLELQNYKKEKLENDKNKLQTQIESSVVDVHLKSAKLRKNMCESVIECVGQAIEQFYEKRKPELERHVSHVFSSLTNSPNLYYGIEIDRDFRMRVVRYDGTKLPTHMYSPSAGASQIVAISLIGGLNKFTTKGAPIVIDTPMGRLDPVHRENLISYYSKMGKQIIILYQPSELSDSDIQSISNNLASEWEIDSVKNHSDISQIIKTESYI